MHSELIGTTISGRYTLKSLLGTGGMGVVFLAIDKQLERQVAVKIISSPASNIKRFERECQVLARIKGPQIPEVFAWGACSNGSPFLVMEFLSGQTLEGLLLRKELSVAELRVVFRQVCSGLSLVHEQGVIHRDLKPSNIMVERNADGIVVKIMDFGIARLMNTEQNLTRSNELVGSNGYLSPEHLSSSLIDARSDIFSMGCVMYKAITGVPPFEDSSPMNSLMRMTCGKYEEPVGVDKDIIRAIRKCLQVKPEDRFQTAEELRVALSADVSDSGPVVKSWSSKVSKRTRLPVILLVTGLVLSCVVGIVWNSKWNTRREMFVSGGIQSIIGKAVDAAKEGNWHKVDACCEELNAQPPDRWHSAPASVCHDLGMVARKAAAEKSFATSLRVYALAKEAAKLSPLARKRNDYDEVVNDELGTLMEYWSSGKPGIKKQRTLVALASVSKDSRFRKGLLLTLADIELELQHFGAARAHLNEALALPTITPLDQQRTAWVATRANAAMPPAMLESEKWLTKVQPEILGLCGQDTKDSISIFNSYTEAVQSSIPSFYQKNRQFAHTLINVLEEWQLRSSLSESEKLEAEITKDIFRVDLKEPDARWELLRHLRQAVDMHCHSDHFHCLVSTIQKRVAISPGLLQACIEDNPSSWFKNGRLQGLVGQLDLHALQFLWSNCRTVPQEIRALIAACLITKLDIEGRYGERDSFVMHNEDYLRCENFAQAVFACYARRTDVKGLTDLLARLDTMPECETRTLCAAVLANVLELRGERLRARELLAEVSRSRFAMNTEVIRHVAEVYRRLFDTRSEKRLAAYIMRALGSPFDVSLLRAAVHVANCCDAVGCYEEADLILERIKNVENRYDENVFEHTATIFERRADVDSLLRLVQEYRGHITAGSESLLFIEAVAANMLLGKSRSKEALDLLKSIGANEKSYSERVLWQLCVVWSQLGRADELLALRERALRSLKPSSVVDAITARAVLRLLEDKKYREAEAIIPALSLHDGNFKNDVAVILSSIYYRRNDLTALQGLWKQARELGAEEFVLCGISIDIIQTLEFKGQLREAKQWQERLSREVMQRRDPESLVRLDRFYQYRGDIAGMRAVTACFMNNGTDCPGQFLEVASEHCVGLVRWQLADEAYRLAEVIQHSPQWYRAPRVASNLINIYYQQLDLPKLRSLLVLFSSDPKCSKALQVRLAAYLANTCHLTGDEDSATSILSSIMRIPNAFVQDQEANLSICALLVKRRDVEALARILKESASLRPADRTTLKCMYAWCLNYRGETAELNRVLAEIESELKTNSDAGNSSTLADLYNATGNVCALDSFSKWISKERPGFSESVLLRFAQCLMSNGQATEAERVIDALLAKQSGPLSSSVVDIVARTEAIRPNLPALFKLFNSECAGSDRVVCGAFLTHALYKTGRKTEALKMLAELKHDPLLTGNTVALAALGSVAEQQGDVSSLRLFQTYTRRLSYSNIQIRMIADLRLVVALASHGEYGSAATILHSAEPVALLCGDPSDLMLLAKCYGIFSNVAGLRKILDVYPGGSFIAAICTRASIRLTLARCLQNKEEAKKVVAEAIAELEQSKATNLSIAAQLAEARALMRKLD